MKQYEQYGSMKLFENLVHDLKRSLERLNTVYGIDNILFSQETFVDKGVSDEDCPFHIISNTVSVKFKNISAVMFKLDRSET